MFLDIDDQKLIILSKDKETYNLRFLDGLFNKALYKSDNYHEETFESVKAVLYDNLFIKNNLYSNTLSNNVKQREDVYSVEKLQSLNDIDNLDYNELKELKEIKKLEELEETKKLEELETELDFNIKSKYYFNIKVKYLQSEIIYVIDLKGYELLDMLHLFNLLENNILYHFVDIYRYKGNKKYLNLKYNSYEVINYLDKVNYRFNEFNLFIFINLNKKEFQRVHEFMRYSVLQLHKLDYDYKELNKLYILLSKYIYKGDVNSLFKFLYEFHYFKVRAYHNFDYAKKLKRLVLKDDRFELNLDNRDEELGYINICFHEKPYYERFAICEDIEESKEDMKERREENTYFKGYKQNNHGFDSILGDVRGTELMYNDEFYKAHEYKNENRRTH